MLRENGSRVRTTILFNKSSDAKSCNSALRTFRTHIIILPPTPSVHGMSTWSCARSSYIRPKRKVVTPIWLALRGVRHLSDICRTLQNTAEHLSNTAEHWRTVGGHDAHKHKRY